jgi:hypothetical protein
MIKLRRTTVIFALVVLAVLSACRNPTSPEPGPDTAAPGEPSGLAAIGEFGQITLSWTDPGDDDLSRIEITRSPGSGTVSEVQAGVQAFAVTGLSEGTEYTFTLAAVDVNGNRSAEQSVSATLPPSNVTMVSASNGVADDEFGVSVALDGDYAVISSEDYPANARDGIVYVFERDGSGNWSEETSFGAPSASEEGLGADIGISGSSAISGAPRSDASGEYALVIDRDASGTWTSTKIVSSDLGADDEFGSSVDISGDYAIVGAYRNDTAGSFSGAAYVFERSAGAWPTTETAKLVASDISSGIQFGRAVAISGSYAAVGAPYRADGALQQGAVYLFERDGSGNWVETAILSPSEPVTDLEFGTVVALSDDILAAYAPNYSEVESFAGAVFVFERDSTGTWTETARLEASDIAASDSFGKSIDISGNLMVVGAERGDAGSTTDAGAAYVYRRTSPGNWFEITKLTSPTPEAGSDFGGAAAISGSTVLIGADRADIGGSADIGQAYIFE